MRLKPLGVRHDEIRLLRLGRAVVCAEEEDGDIAKEACGIQLSALMFLQGLLEGKHGGFSGNIYAYPISTVPNSRKRDICHLTLQPSHGPEA